MPRRKNSKNELDHAPGTRLVAWAGLVLGALALISLVVFGLRHELSTLGLSMLGVVAGSLATAKSKKHPSARQVAYAGLIVSGLALVVVVLWMMAVSPEGSVAF
jgi:hypothetical protein